MPRQQDRAYRGNDRAINRFHDTLTYTRRMRDLNRDLVRKKSLFALSSAIESVKRTPVPPSNTISPLAPRNRVRPRGNFSSGYRESWDQERKLEYVRRARNVCRIMLVPLPLVARDASWPASTPLANPLLAYQSRINAKRGHATEARRRLPEDASCKNKRTGSLGMSRDSVLYRSLAYIDTNLCPPQAVLCICHIHIPISPSLSILLLRVSFSSSSVLPFLSSPSHALPFILNRFFLLFIFLSLAPSVRGSPPPCLCVLVSLLVSDQTRLYSSRSLSSFLLVSPRPARPSVGPAVPRSRFLALSASVSSPLVSSPSSLSRYSFSLGSSRSLPRRIPGVHTHRTRTCTTECLSPFAFAAGARGMELVHAHNHA